MPINSQKTFAFKERMRIGREIADQLDPLMTVDEVAKRVGLSKVMVRRIECLALYKIAQRMWAHRAEREDELNPAKLFTPKRAKGAHIGGTQVVRNII